MWRAVEKEETTPIPEHQKDFEEGLALTKGSAAVRCISPSLSIPPAALWMKRTSITYGGSSAQRVLIEESGILVKVSDG